MTWASPVKGSSNCRWNAAFDDEFRGFPNLNTGIELEIMLAMSAEHDLEHL